MANLVMTRLRKMLLGLAAIGTAFVGLFVLTVDRGDPNQPLLEAQVDCTTHIDVVSYLPDGFQVYHDTIAIRSNFIHQLRRRDNILPSGPSFRFSKHPILVRPGHNTKITLADEFLDSVRLDWSEPDAFVQRVSVGPCAGEPDDWLVFAGGTWVVEPSCVDLIVQSSGRQSLVPL